MTCWLAEKGLPGVSSKLVNEASKPEPNKGTVVTFVLRVRGQTANSTGLDHSRTQLAINHHAQRTPPHWAAHLLSAVRSERPGKLPPLSCKESARSAVALTVGQIERVPSCTDNKCLEVATRFFICCLKSCSLSIIASWYDRRPLFSFRVPVGHLLY